MTFAEAVGARRGALRHASARSAPTRRRASPGKYKGARRRALARLLATRACVVEVEVDPATGWIHVPKIWIAHDIGRALNPVLARGQVEGGVYMGLGEALMEEQVVPPPAAEALRRAGAQASLDARVQEPDRARHAARSRLLIEDPDPNGPFGAKEVGQGPLLPVMPAVANAIYDAVGVRVDESPDHAGQGAEGAACKAQGEARVGPESVPGSSVPRARLFVLPPWEGGDGNARSARSPPDRCMMRCRGSSTAPRARSRRRRRSWPARARARCSSPAAPTSCRT